MYSTGNWTRSVIHPSRPNLLISSQFRPFGSKAFLSLSIGPLSISDKILFGKIHTSHMKLAVYKWTFSLTDSVMCGPQPSSFLTLTSSTVIVCNIAPCGAGAPRFPLVHLLPHLFPFLLFPFFHWLYLFSSFVHPFPFYQNSPTPFPGRVS